MALNSAPYPAPRAYASGSRWNSYLDSIKKADEEQQTAIDHSAVRAALKLQQHPEPEARFMPVAGILPHVPVKRAVNNQGGGTLFGHEQFRY